MVRAYPIWWVLFWTRCGTQDIQRLARALVWPSSTSTWSTCHAITRWARTSTSAPTRQKIQQNHFWVISVKPGGAFVCFFFIEYGIMCVIGLVWFIMLKVWKTVKWVSKNFEKMIKNLKSNNLFLRFRGDKLQNVWYEMKVRFQI